MPRESQYTAIPDHERYGQELTKGGHLKNKEVWSGYNHGEKMTFKQALLAD
jgi:hypothetical protein